MKFDNRLLATAVGAGVAGNPSVLSNVGSVTTKGIEAAATWSITPDWSLFGSYSYNDSKYDDDVIDGSGALVARTGGRTVVDTPKSLANLQLSYGLGTACGKCVPSAREVLNTCLASRPEQQATGTVPAEPAQRTAS